MATTSTPAAAQAEPENEKWTGFTPEQQQMIVKFVQTTKSRSPWSDLAKLMGMKGKLARFRIRDEWTEKLNPELYLGPLSREAKLTIWHELVLSPRYLDHRGRASWKRLKQDHQCVATYPKTKLRNYYAQWKDSDAASVEYHSLMHQERLVRDAGAGPATNTPFPATQGHSNGNMPQPMVYAQLSSHQMQPDSSPYPHSSFDDLARAARQSASQSHANGTAPNSQQWAAPIRPGHFSAAPMPAQRFSHGYQGAFYAPRGAMPPASTQGLVPASTGSNTDFHTPTPAHFPAAQDVHAHAQYGISIDSAASSLQDHSLSLPSSPAVSFMDSISHTTPQATSLRSTGSPAAGPAHSMAAHMHTMGAKAQVAFGGARSGVWSVPAQAAQGHHTTLPPMHTHSRGTKRGRTAAGMQQAVAPGHVEVLSLPPQRQKRVALPAGGGGARPAGAEGLPAHVVYNNMPPPRQQATELRLPAYSQAPHASVGV